MTGINQGWTSGGAHLTERTVPIGDNGAERRAIRTKHSAREDSTAADRDGAAISPFIRRIPPIPFALEVPERCPLSARGT